MRKSFKISCMKDPILLEVRKFLSLRLVSKKPLLIGYSGGPDSKALLYLLLECRRFFSFELHVAHLDHGWREESRKEAQEIQDEIELLGLTFHLKSLSMKDFYTGNSEQQGREYRFDFFSQIYSELGAQALLLGHQADDQAETILKRVFEGASFFSLTGLSMETTFCNMRIWRPLLKLEKKTILQWLAKKGLNHFTDATNFQKRFLR